MRRNLVPYFAPAIAIALAAGACGEDSGGADGGVAVTLSAEITSDQARNTVAAIHFWVVAPRDAEENAALLPPRCADLIARTRSPYDPTLRFLGSAAVYLPETSATAAIADGGGALVFAMAKAHDGRIVLAGCTEADIAPGATVAVTLVAAGISDCADPDTPDGARCDDGLLCTVGESCDGGSCQGGHPLDCSYLASGCTVGQCDETAGCQQAPAPEGTTCNDGLFCTVNDVCTAGVCAGATNDCSSVVTGDCEIGVCDEDFDFCTTEDKPLGTECDDGFLCTDGATCSSFGTCQTGATKDCSAVADQCNSGVCDAVTGECEAEPITGLSCNDADACTTLDTCSSTGECVGTPVDVDGDGFPPEACGGTDCDDGDGTVSPDDIEVCTDAIDNDCDDLTDAADTADCP